MRGGLHVRSGDNLKRGPLNARSYVHLATIEEFARITRRIIAGDGFAEYLPTALYPERREIVVLEHAPESGDLEAIAVRWAADRAIDGEEFLVAFNRVAAAGCAAPLNTVTLAR